MGKSATSSNTTRTDRLRTDRVAKTPLHLSLAWDEVERRIRLADHVAFFTDFDGTLAPLARSPNQVRLAERVRQSLTTIARKGAIVGVVSGRKLTDLETRVAVPGIWYVGAHGYFLRRAGVPTVTLLNPAQRAEMARIRRRLAHELCGIPGILLEPKQATLAIHHRDASQPSCRTALTTIRELLKEFPHLHLLAGKKVWELLPASGVTKWTAIRLILERERQDRPAWRDRWLVIYLGDDATDELVFAKMRGISVAVGKRRDTAAAFFLHSTREVREFLEKLCEMVK